MTPSARVVLALTPVAEQALARHLFGPAASVEVCASVAEADELTSNALLGVADAVLVSPGLSGFSDAVCAAVRATGTRIVGVALDGREQETLDRLGIDATIDEAVSADELLAVTLPRPAHPPSPPLSTPPPVARIVQEPAGDGSVLAVVGSKGAPGASECACSLAWLVARRWPCLLVELDGLGGALDVRLAADGHQGSIVGLVRAARAGRPARELVDRWLVDRAGWPPVLLGPPDRDRTVPELAEPGAVHNALRALRGLTPLTVVDLGFLLADTSEGTPAVLVHREALQSADGVVLVIGAREPQLRAGLEQLETLLRTLEVPPERLRIVLNGSGGPASCPTEMAEQLLDSRLAEHGLALDACLPWDARALRRATADGLPLAAARPRGRYARTLAALVEQLFLPVAPVPRARKHKLAISPSDPRPPAPQNEGEEEVALSWRTP